MKVYNKQLRLILFVKTFIYFLKAFFLFQDLFLTNFRDPVEQMSKESRNHVKEPVTYS